MPLNIHSSEAFAQHIEKQVRQSKMTYIDAILHFCETHQLEADAIVPYLSTKMKTMMQHEGQNLHLLRKRRELPLED